MYKPSWGEIIRDATPLGDLARYFGLVNPETPNMVIYTQADGDVVVDPVTKRTLPRKVFEKRMKEHPGEYVNWSPITGWGYDNMTTYFDLHEEDYL